MARPLSELNNRHIAYVMFRLGGYSNKEVAEVLGFSVATLISWSKDPLVRELRETLAADMKGVARSYIESLLPEIIHTMAGLMRGGYSERIRLDAASRLLDKALPAETIAKITGDPNAPILHTLLKSDADRKVHDQLVELTPEQRDQLAAAINILETAQPASGD